MRRDLGDAVAIVVQIAVVLAALVALIWLGWREHAARTACEDSGGRVEEYDCSTSMVCSAYDENGSCSWWTPVKSCQWRCVGQPAEHS